MQTLIPHHFSGHALPHTTCADARTTQEQLSSQLRTTTQELRHVTYLLEQSKAGAEPLTAQLQEARQRAQAAEAAAARAASQAAAAHRQEVAGLRSELASLKEAHEALMAENARLLAANSQIASDLHRAQVGCRDSCCNEEGATMRRSSMVCMCNSLDV